MARAILAGRAADAATVVNSFKKSRRSVLMRNSPLWITFAVIASGRLAVACFACVTIQWRLCDFPSRGEIGPGSDLFPAPERRRAWRGPQRRGDSYVSWLDNRRILEGHPPTSKKPLTLSSSLSFICCEKRRSSGCIEIVYRVGAGLFYDPIPSEMIVAQSSVIRVASDEKRLKRQIQMSNENQALPFAWLVLSTPRPRLSRLARFLSFLK
jgi:hypothetical protein